MSTLEEYNQSQQALLTALHPHKRKNVKRGAIPLNQQPYHKLCDTCTLQHYFAERALDQISLTEPRLKPQAPQTACGFI